MPQSDSTSPRFIKAHKDYISSGSDAGISTPFNRLKTVGSATYKAASTVIKSTVKMEGSIVTVNYGMADPIKLDLQKLSLTAFEAIVSFQTSVNALVGPAYSIKSFPCHRLKDDFARVAPFKQKHNAEWLDPYRFTIRNRIFNHFHLFTTSGTIDEDACVRWLDSDQTALRALAVVFCITCGISPHQHEFRMLYDSSSARTRDIWILPNNLVICVNPIARPKDDRLMQAVFALPCEVSSAITFYLNIVRPIACEILKELGRDVSCYETEVWSHFRHQTYGSERWSGPDISQAVQAHTLKVMRLLLTPEDIRCVVRAIFSHFFPDVAKHHQDSIVDRAAQHTNTTSLGHYGRLGSFPPIPGVRFDQPVRFTEISQIWQHILHLGPPNEAWITRLQNSGLMVQGGHDVSSPFGLFHARRAIQLYGALDPESVRSLIKLLPFVYGKQVSSTHSKNCAGIPS